MQYDSLLWNSSEFWVRIWSGKICKCDWKQNTIIERVCRCTYCCKITEMPYCSYSNPLLYCRSKHREGMFWTQKKGQIWIQHPERSQPFFAPLPIWLPFIYESLPELSVSGPGEDESKVIRTQTQGAKPYISEYLKIQYHPNTNSIQA